MELERRKYRRFRLDDVCIINHDKTVGTVVDLSVGGISCKCMASESLCNEGVDTKIDIYCKTPEACAKNISMKVLGCEIIRGKFSESFNARKCRAQFQHLDDFQEAQLSKIIEKSPSL